MTALERELASMRAEMLADSNLLTRHKAGEVVLTADQAQAISRRAKLRGEKFDLYNIALDHAEGR